MSTPDVRPGISARSEMPDLSNLSGRVPSHTRVDRTAGLESRSAANIATDGLEGHMASLHWNETDANKEDRQAKEKKDFDLEHPQRPLLETIFGPVSGWIKNFWGRF